MEERTIRSVLRLIAVVTMLFGLVHGSRTILALWGTQSAMGSFGELGGMEQMSTRLGSWMVAADLATWGWGLALYAASEYLARRIAS